MSTNQRSKVGRKRGTPKRLGGRQIIGGALPQLNASLKLTRTFRFLADADVNRDINVFHVKNLLGIGYHSAIPANGIYRLIDNFRLRRVRLYYANPGSAVPVTVALDWISGTYAESNRMSATSLGVVPAELIASPPAQSTAAFWCGGTDLALFHIQVPQNTIVEITVQFVLVDNTGSFVTTVNTVVDASFYVKPLDSTLGSTAGNLQPLGYPNVITI